MEAISKKRSTSRMEISIFFLVLVFLLQTPQSLSTYVLEEGSSLSVEESNDYLISKNGVYSAGFFSVGINTYCFAIWFTKSSPLTVAWMANRDNPVNGKGSRISVMKNGDLSLTDAGRILIWNSKTFSPSPVQLVLLDSGNLVLHNSSVTIWESFDSPTDTLLPQQLITRDTKLVSSRSGSDYSSGFYSFYFDNDNVLRLLYDDSEVSSAYWPDPSQMAWVFRTTYNNSRIAVFDNLGDFLSSDKLSFRAADFGLGPQRRLTLDFDGSVRMYSLMEAKGTWTVTWQSLSTCSVHGLCGQNNLCNYDPKTGRSCSCLPGFKLKNHLDWSLGCVPDPESIIHCNQTNVDFLKLPHVDFYGNDFGIIKHSNLSHCRKICAQSCDCKAFTFKSNQGDNKCYPKFLLHNGLRSIDFHGITYVKLPKASSVFQSNSSDKSKRKETWDCPRVRPTEELNRVYKKRKVNETQRILLWFAGGVGAVEITCMFLVWFCLYWTSNDPDDTKEGYILAATGFKLFSYGELKKATNGFSQEIGKGAGGVVYKGVLSDGRVAAIKRLSEASQGEAEFLAEVSIIGKLNHMNLIEMWGYCVEGKHRLLVSEYMEHGSLAQNLSSNVLKWKNRFEIAVGTAKGLAYLHEECLEWILHCDIKPQNILLDSNYQPRVADFGLSKLLNRGGHNNSSFSKIRGTRGYMAPEWVYTNLPITSKVDVYSYGIVLLEMITGRNPTAVQSPDYGDLAGNVRLVSWMREKIVNMAASSSTECYWIDEIVDPLLESEYNSDELERLIKVALLCLEENKDARPTMSQVLEMILCDDDDLTLQ